MTYHRFHSPSMNLQQKIKPNNFLLYALAYLKKGSYFLDLGSGRGADSLFMATKGFIVKSVDSSKKAIRQLQEKILKNKLKNIEAVCVDLINFEIEPEKYDIIYGANVFQFLPKNIIFKIIADIKRKVKSNGYVIISSFTTNDPSIKLPKEKRFTSYFSPGQLSNLFQDFKIIYYYEDIILDKGHPGALKPHYHGVVRMIAQKSWPSRISSDES